MKTLADRGGNYTIENYLFDNKNWNAEIINHTLKVERIFFVLIKCLKLKIFSREIKVTSLLNDQYKRLDVKYG